MQTIYSSCLKCNEKLIDELTRRVINIFQTINIYFNYFRLKELSSQLNELNISFNSFSEMPASILNLTNLSSLDLRANKISDIPIEFIQLRSLRELIISDNKFQEIPNCIYQLPILENLFANNNQIKLIDGNKIVEMKFLKILNLQNNDIATVPPILGKATQIK